MCTSTLSFSTPLRLHMIMLIFFSMIPCPPSSTLFPYTTLFRSQQVLFAGRHRNFNRVEDLFERFLRDIFRNTRTRSEEHTSELQSRQYLVCRLLLEKKKNADDQSERQNVFHLYTLHHSFYT